MNIEKTKNEMKKINLAMTFYGGVSLAVFEAGVAEEFLRFLQFCRERRHQHEDLNNLDINVRVISGTSAGGLAAILLSSALVNSEDPSRHIREMRRIWFDVADLSTIRYRRGQKVRSLLNNDILEDEVIRFLKLKEGKNGLSEDLKILITATNMQGFFDAVPVEHDFTATKKFAERAFSTTRHTEVFVFSEKDIKDEDRQVQERIAKAARITSTFPVAFPPQFTLSPSFSKENIQWYKETGRRDKPLHFWYFDGGVLDNKPLGHAIDHMQSSRHEGDWWYFFVEPKPQSYQRRHPEWATDPDTPPDPAETVMAVLEARGAETIYHDLRRIQKINHQLMQIKRLLEDVWELLDSSRLSGSLFETFKDNVLTSRLHRFLPDYLKCITLIRYLFIRKNLLSQEEKDRLKEKQELILSEIPPLDLPRTFADSLYDKTIKKILSSDMIKQLKEDQEIRKVLKDFDKKAAAIKEAQLLFRQIAFWVERDHKKDQKISNRTWKRFKESEAALEKALSKANGAFQNFMKRLKEVIKDDQILAKIKCYVLLNEAVHAAGGLETRERIKVIKIYNDIKEYGELAGAKLANFAGFLDRRWRKHDYLMGLINTREMLKGRLCEVIPSDDFWKDYEDWRSKSEGNFDQEYSLTSKDILKDHEKELESLPAGKVIADINAVLHSSKVIIQKSKSKFFSILRAIKVQWILPVIQGILWLFRQATAGSPTEKKRMGPHSLAVFKKKSRQYIGFILIGILLGLLLSFFLPDFLGNFADWILKQLIPD